MSIFMSSSTPSGYTFGLPSEGSVPLSEAKKDPIVQAVSSFADPIGDFVSDVRDALGEIGHGLGQMWYNLTGQTHKTDAYQALQEYENTSYQRMVGDMRAAGLSPYFASGTGNQSSSSAGQGQTSGLQFMNALVDLFFKKSQVDNLKAQTEHTKADTQSIQTRNGYLPDLLELEVAEGNARVQLTKDHSAQIAENILASVQGRAIACVEHQANLILKASQTELNKANASYTTESMNLLHAKIEHEYEAIAKSMAERYHLSYEDQLLVADYAQRVLQTEIMKWNYDYSFEHGLRTTDSPTKIFGINADQFADIFLSNPFKFMFKNTSIPGTGGKGGGYAW